MGQQNCETSAVIVFAYRLDYKGLRWSYVTELLDTLWVLSFLREILPFHVRFSVMPFHCVHIISIWSFTINRYLPDDKCVPRCISALLISKNCMTQFLWLSGRFFFQLASAVFALLRSLTETTKTTRAPQGTGGLRRSGALLIERASRGFSPEKGGGGELRTLLYT